MSATMRTQGSESRVASWIISARAPLICQERRDGSPEGGPPRDAAPPGTPPPPQLTRASALLRTAGRSWAEASVHAPLFLNRGALLAPRCSFCGHKTVSTLYSNGLHTRPILVGACGLALLCALHPMALPLTRAATASGRARCPPALLPVHWALGRPPLPAASEVAPSGIQAPQLPAEQETGMLSKDKHVPPLSTHYPEPPPGHQHPCLGDLLVGPHGDGETSPQSR